MIKGIDFSIGLGIRISIGIVMGLLIFIGLHAFNDYLATTLLSKGWQGTLGLILLIIIEAGLALTLIRRSIRKIATDWSIHIIQRGTAMHSHLGVKEDDNITLSISPVAAMTLLYGGAAEQMEAARREVEQSLWVIVTEQAPQQNHNSDGDDPFDDSDFLQPDILREVQRQRAEGVISDNDRVILT